MARSFNTRAKRIAFLAWTVALLATLIAPAQSQAATVTSAATIDAYLATKNSPMVGQGAAFITSGAAWKVDPRLLVAIAGAESSFGVHICGPFNGWGYGCPVHPYKFDSWAEAIDTVANGLRTNYLAEGRTSVALIGAKYAPVGASNDPTNLNSAWVINVSGFLIEQGGDPTNVDLDGVAGSMPLGLEIDPLANEFQYKVVDSGQSTDALEQAELVATADSPAHFILTVKNSGSADWTRETVRLRRVDQFPRITSAPYASLTTDTVKAGASAKFTVDISTAGLQSASALTEWRLEGPAGPFGDHIMRPVRVVVSPFVMGPSKVEAPGSLDPAESSAIIVKIQNFGSDDWVRDGDDKVMLGLEKSTGASLQDARWLSANVVSELLQRRVAPGEWASFAFPITMGQGVGPSTMELRVFRGDTLSSGSPVRVSVERTS